MKRMKSDHSEGTHTGMTKCVFVLRSFNNRIVNSILMIIPRRHYEQFFTHVGIFFFVYLK
jgi:hypothetical protein